MDELINYISMDWSNKELVLLKVKKFGWQLYCAHKSLKKDKEVVLAAVNNQGSALNYADDSLKNDREVVLTAVKRDGTALQYVPDLFKKDKNITLAAVKNDGLALCFADESFKKDKEVVMAATRSARALKYIDSSLINDREVVLNVVKYNTYALYYLNTQHRKNINIYRWSLYWHERFDDYGDEEIKNLYRFLENELVAEKYFNIFKYGNEIIFHPMQEQSDIIFNYYM